jgi:hypothetical protein
MIICKGSEIFLMIIDKRDHFYLINSIFFLLLLDIPSVQVLQPQYSVNFGDSVTLECVVSGNPTHTSVSWLRVINGQTSSINFGLNKYSGSTVNTPSLTVNSAEISDEGNYICTATNSIGTGQSSQTFLDVVGSMYTNIFNTLMQVLSGYFFNPSVSY